MPAKLIRSGETPRSTRREGVCAAHPRGCNRGQRPTFNHPNSDERLGYPLAKCRRKCLSHGGGLFAQHFDESLIASGGFGLLGVAIDDNLACGDKAFEQGFFV